jgi:4-aminobutyrate--pyruvate transaminase
MLDRPGDHAKAPANDSAAARDIAYHLHPFTNMHRLESEGPFVITRGDGIRVFDDQGRSYIDAMAGLWCTSLGFSEKRLAEVAYRQMLELPYASTFGQRSHPTVIALAEKLISLMPVPMSKVFFNNSGSEANDTAAKMVWYYNNAIGRPRKKKIIGRMKGYHGITVASGSLCGLPYVHQDFDLPIPNIRHTDCPHFYRYGKLGETEDDFATRMAENLDALIQREGPDSVAAFIAEPVQGAGGVIIPPRTYFAKVQEVLRRYDVLFIADEVICGFGRTGNMFGCETFDIQPDIMTVAKALSSAYLPISATVINDKVYQGLAANSDKVASFTHGFTYSGHPVCAAVALETLKIYQERGLIGHVQKISPRFLAGVRQFADHPLVGEVRAVGLMAGIELVRDKATKTPFDAKAGVGNFFEQRAYEAGILMRGRGEQLVLSPPLIITESEIDDLLSRLGRALDATAEMVKAA